MGHENDATQANKLEKHRPTIFSSLRSATVLQPRLTSRGVSPRSGDSVNINNRAHRARQ